MNPALVLCEALVSPLESAIPTLPSERESADSSLQVEPSPLPVSVNTASLEHSHAFPCMRWLWLRACYTAELRERPDGL